MSAGETRPSGAPAPPAVVSGGGAQPPACPGCAQPSGGTGDGAHAPSWPAALGLWVTIAGAACFVVAFALGWSTQWLGGALAAALLGLGLALAWWGRDLAGDEVASGSYPVPSAGGESRAAFEAALDSHVQTVTRRRFLARLLVAGLGVFALSQAVLLGALGPRPRRSLATTGWRTGTRLVTLDGASVTRDALRGGGFLVAFPEGQAEAANSQVVLFHFGGVFRPRPGRESWSPEGFVAYSRVCTHAGCSVAQYEDEAQVLVCPCHQSTFDVLDGARPVSGPAGRALPQLPLTIAADGGLVAQGDFPEPVGAGFWNAS